MRVVIRLAGLLAFVAAAGALVVRFLPATNRPLLAVAALAPYLMLGAPLAVLLFALARRWTLLAAAAVLTVAVMATQFPWYIGSPAPNGVTVRFVTANLRYGDAQPTAVAATARDHADVLAVQELTPALADALSPVLAPYFPYHALRAREGPAGVGLWSRHPISHSATDESFWLGFISAQVQLPGVASEVTVVSTHLSAPWPDEFRGWRDDISRLGAVLAGLPAGPVILGGDLNATPDVREFRDLLRDGYDDGARQAAAGLTRTHPADIVIPPVFAVDHVLTRQAVVTSMTTLPIPGSDHRGLAATVVVG